VAGKIAENMSASIVIPLATSQRTIAVKVMDENRRIINQHRTLIGRGKVSYTHLIGWAVIKAVEDVPVMNHAGKKDGRRGWYREHLGIGDRRGGQDGGTA
jgi:2-oxoglutarate dehydrogenase E1 component